PAREETVREEAAPEVPSEHNEGPEPQAKPPRAEDASTQLTRAFSVRRREIEACFTAHSAAVPEAPRLNVDFEIAVDGRVSRAHLEPSRVESTELGRCVLRVAEKTRFPRQQSTLRF